MLTTLEERVHIQHSALLIVDMQNDFAHNDGAFAKMGINVSMFQKIIPNLLRLIQMARTVNVPVIFIQMIHSKWTNSDAWIQRIRVGDKGWKHDEPSLPYGVPGTWGAEEIEELVPTDDDFVVIKHRYSGFVNTDLDLVLRSLKKKTVVATGGETNLCLGNTAMGALMNDYYVILPEDCIAGIDEESHRHGLQILGNYCGIVVPSEEILKIWEKQNQSR